MNNISPLAINEIYSCSQYGEIIPHPLNYEEFEKLCISLKKFEKKLREEEVIEEDYWKKFLRPFRKYRFQLSATPLPFNHLIINSSEISELDKKLAVCNSLYPSFCFDASNLREELRNLLQLADNPIIDLIIQLYREFQGKKVGLLIKESRWIPSVQEILSAHDGLSEIELLSPFQLREAKCYDKLLVVGPARWFPDYVFSAPRARQILILSYSWINNKWKPKQLFLGSNMPPTEPEIVWETEKVQTLVETRIEPNEIWSFNWDKIIQGFSRTSTNNYEAKKDVKARLFKLEGNYAVFLDSEVSTTVIELAKNGKPVIEKIPVGDIEPGTFIPLRKGAGGDLIVLLADRLLGTKVESTRALQKEWKDRLRQEINSSSLHSITNSLAKLGSSKANISNVRNWVSENFIKPDDDSDFNAILRLVGLQDRKDEFMEAAKLIDSAHRRAGHEIRKRLLSKLVLEAKLAELKQLGFLTFELEEGDGGSMTFFRVVDVDPNLHNLTISQIAKPFEIED